MERECKTKPTFTNATWDLLSSELMNLRKDAKYAVCVFVFRACQGLDISVGLRLCDMCVCVRAHVFICVTAHIFLFHEEDFNISPLRSLFMPNSVYPWNRKPSSLSLLKFKFFINLLLQE